MYFAQKTVFFHLCKMLKKYFGNADKQGFLQRDKRLLYIFHNGFYTDICISVCLFKADCRVFKVAFGKNK